MALRRVLASSALFVIAACEGLPDQPTCVWNPPAEPEPCPGETAVSSTFPYNGIRESEILGRVYRGRALLPDTLVHVRNATDRAPPPGRDFPPATVFTNAGGLYRVLQIGPRYDLLAVSGRDVLARDGITARYFEPVFDGVGAPRAWTTHVVTTVNNRAPGRSLRFFVGGAFVYGSRGDAERGLDVGFGEFTSKAVVHVVEVPDGGDLTHATASANREVELRADIAAAVTLDLAPITAKAPITFATQGGAGFAPGDVELRLDFGVYDARELVTTIPIGQTREVALIPGMALTAQVRATNAAGEIDSGQVFFDPAVSPIPLELPDGVATLAAPMDGESVETNGTLSTTVGGVFEHVLEPLDPNAPTITIGTASDRARVPDLAMIALPRATGTYRWRVRAYPALDSIDQLTGVFLRVGKMATSAPRTIVLR